MQQTSNIFTDYVYVYLFCYGFLPDSMLSVVINVVKSMTVTITEINWTSQCDVENSGKSHTGSYVIFSAHWQ